MSKNVMHERYGTGKTRTDLGKPWVSQSQTGRYAAVLEHVTDGDGGKENRKFPSC